MSRKRANNFEISLSNIDEFSLQQLETIIPIIKEELMKINLSLDEAKINKKEGLEVDSNWFVRLKKAKRIKGYQHQLIQKQIKELRKANNIDLYAEQKARDQKFNILKAVIYDLLPEETAKSVMLELGTRLDELKAYAQQHEFDDYDF